MKPQSLASLAAAFLFVAAPAPAADGPTNALQNALFEEEANHNLAAAVRDYQAVIARLDEDRKVAATAVFRLAECYRKLGQTNEANLQYQRVLRDFSDQPRLVEFSRLVLEAAGPPPSPGAVPAGVKSIAIVADGKVYRPATEAEAEMLRSIVLGKESAAAAIPGATPGTINAEAIRPATVVFYGEIKGNLRLPPGQPKYLSESILNMKPNEFANLKKVKLIRHDPVTGKAAKPVFVNVEEILSKGARDKDYLLQDGDYVYVTQKMFNFK